MLLILVRMRVLALNYGYHMRIECEWNAQRGAFGLFGGCFGYNRWLVVHHQEACQCPEPQRLLLQELLEVQRQFASHLQCQHAIHICSSGCYRWYQLWVGIQQASELEALARYYPQQFNILLGMAISSYILY